MKRILQYEIIHELGRGKNGPTYLTYDTGLQRAVVLKLLEDRRGVTEEWAEDFRGRTAPWLLLDDRRLVFFHSIERVDGHWCIIREYIEGDTLADIAGENGVAYRRCLEIALQAADILRLVHDRGLVHENLTARNFFVDRAGQLRLADFGLGPETAEVVDGATAPGDLVYLPPERLNGNITTHLGDIYSLGVTLHRLLSGRFPWPLEAGKDLRRRILDDPLIFEAVPAGSTGEIARLLFAKMLAPEPSERFASAENLQTTLQGMLALDTGEVEVAPESRWKLTSRQYLSISILVLLLIILWLVITSFPR